MSNKSNPRRALKIAAGIALGTFAIGAQAEPFTLEGICSLSSIVAGQATCQLTFFLSDDFLDPTSIRKAQVKVNGILVTQYNNDNLNPSEFSVGASGTTTVQCGATHNVTAFIARVSPTSVYEKVGSLPPLACPAAP